MGKIRSDPLAPTLNYGHLSRASQATRNTEAGARYQPVRLVGRRPGRACGSHFFYVPFGTALLCHAGAVYLSFAVSWSHLDWKTRNEAIKGHNAFVIFAVFLFVLIAAGVSGHWINQFLST